MQYSSQQIDFHNFIASGKGNGILAASAGSGKSTTLLGGIAKTRGQVAILAYNKSIATEFKHKLEKAGYDWKKAEAGTVHSFGFRAYRKRFPKVKVDENKTRNIFDKYVAGISKTSESLIKDLKKFQSIILRLVSMAKQKAIGVNCAVTSENDYRKIVDHYDMIDDKISEASELLIITTAIKILSLSNSLVEIIDFDDMVYLPLLLKIRFYQYDYVFVDEVQDISTARRLICKAMVKPTGRVMAVGDEKQAIYAFSGGDNDSMELFAKEFGSQSFPLTVTYRCPKKVVEYAYQWIPETHLQAHPSAKDGAIEYSNENEFFSRSDLNESSAVLCRNTAPLVSLAFMCIRRKIPAKIEGRDVAKGIKKLATKWNRVKSLQDLSVKLDDYFIRESDKYTKKKQEYRVQTLQDQVDTLKVIIDQCVSENKNSVNDIVEYIDDIFSDNVSGVMTLATIHRAKGREWENVFWLNRHRTCPSKYAKQDWELQQERNLQYVCATRAMNKLIELTIEEKKKVN